MIIEPELKADIRHWEYRRTVCDRGRKAITNRLGLRV